MVWDFLGSREGDVWSDVVRESYWQVGVDDITFNNQVTGLCEGGCQVC